jgi:hypothetical protein
LYLVVHNVYSLFKIELNYVEDPNEFDSKVQQRHMCVTKIDDIERNEYCFTDGSGLISKGLAKLISSRLDYIVKYEDYVSFYTRSSSIL